MSEVKFYICEKCGKIIGVINPSACPTMCCGEAMKPLVPGTVDAAEDGSEVTAKVAVSSVAAGADAGACLRMTKTATTAATQISTAAMIRMTGFPMRRRFGVRSSSK